MKFKTIVITGASDGIGAAAARQLKALGHRVIIVGRSPEKTERVAKELDAPYHLADYSRLSDVVRLASELCQYPKIDVLANNAGGVQNERVITEDGFERTFQINVLGGFLLTNLLLPKLCESRATVIQTSSIAANLFGSDFDVQDLQNEKNYKPFNAYGAGKLEDILFTRELQRRFGEKGICAVAFEPGVVRTNFASESTPFAKFLYHTPVKYLFTISPDKSARRLTALALGTPGKDFLPKEVYSGKKTMKLKFRDPDGTISKTLWDSCLEMTGKYL
ncbi:MAG: SDR family NAD(P)-dependent oxidoreductase [Ruminococcaceae bacterium]|nr:SDR family NAD(P)-dependent oxidoreductase [Oscillospiraceae bacterium]